MTGVPVGPTTAQILAEWRRDTPAADLTRWREGMNRYDAAPLENQAEMRAASGLMCAVLTHYVAGEIIIPDTPDRSGKTEIGQTIWNVLIASLLGNDQTTWGPVPERDVRLALAAVRRGGHQPVELGGNGGALSQIFDDKGNQMLMTAALWDLSRSGPKSFTLRDWFLS